MIKIADRSEYGWATVPAYVIDDLADTQDDERCISKAEIFAWKAFEAKREKSRSRYTSFKSSNFASNSSSFHTRSSTPVLSEALSVSIGHLYRWDFRRRP